MKRKITNRPPEAANTLSAEVIRKAKEGDKEALSLLYETTHQDIYRTIHAMIRSDDLTMDIEQNTYIQAFSHLDQLRDGESFLPWLKRIAVNETRMQLRRNTPVLFSEMPFQEEEPEIPDDKVETSPELAYDRKETSRLVREILGELTDGQRLLVGMYYYEQIPLNEIAEQLGISQSAAKSLLFRSRKKIENEVRRLEEKGVKLYGLSPVPFLVSLLKQSMPTAKMSAKAAPAILSASGITETVAVHVGRRFLETALGKVVIGLLTVGVISGGVIGYRYWQNAEYRSRTTIVQLEKEETESSPEKETEPTEEILTVPEQPPTRPALPIMHRDPKHKTDNTVSPAAPRVTDPPKTEPAPTDSTSAKPPVNTPSETEPAPSQPAPTEPPQTEPAPTEPAHSQPAPTEPPQTEPAPTEPAHSQPAPTEPPQTETAPTESTPVQPDPTESTSTQPEAEQTPPAPAPDGTEPAESDPTEAETMPVDTAEDLTTAPAEVDTPEDFNLPPQPEPTEPEETDPPEPPEPNIVECFWNKYPGYSTVIYDIPWETTTNLYVISEGEAVPTFTSDHPNVASIESGWTQISMDDLTETQNAYCFRVTSHGPGTAHISCFWNGEEVQTLTVENPEHPDAVLNWEFYGVAKLPHLHDVPNPESEPLYVGTDLYFSAVVQGASEPEIISDHPDVIDVGSFTRYPGPAGLSWIQYSCIWSTVIRNPGTATVSLRLNGEIIKSWTIHAVAAEEEPNAEENQPEP